MFHTRSILTLAKPSSYGNVVAEEQVGAINDTRWRAPFGENRGHVTYLIRQGRGFGFHRGHCGESGREAKYAG